MVKAFIIDPTYKVEDGKACIQLIGRLESGESFVSKHYTKPYFFIKKSDKGKAKEIVEELISNFKSNGTELRVDLEESNFKNFDHEHVIKLITDIPKNIPQIRDRLVGSGVKCYEADIRFPNRFMIDHGINGSMEIEGKEEKGDQRIKRIFTDAKITPAEYPIKLNVLSIDIETSVDTEKIYCIGLYSEDYKKVLIVSNEKVKNAISFKTEKEMLAYFKEKVIELDPDVITGWNLVDFDLTVIEKHFKKHNVDFCLGRTDEKCTIRHSTDFFRESTANFEGRAILDGLHMLKISFVKLDDYKLDTAARELLGLKKAIQFVDKGKEIEDLYKNNKEKLAEYNLMDCELVYRIMHEKGIIELTIQRSLLTGMPISRVNASIASLDSLYIKETIKRGLVCPSSSGDSSEERIKGGFVREPKPGIYDFIDVLDFKSLYPSIIRTFNIDPVSFSKKGTIVAPNGARFLNDEGILPMLIQRLWAKRDLAKKNKNQMASYAIKITMNSFFGVLANPTCRFFSLEMANAITHFGQFIVKRTADEIQNLGYNVVYGDTDSVFIETKAKDTDEAEKIGKVLQKHVNDYYKDYVNKNYGRENFLELEFDKAFLVLLLPKLRGQEGGAKKRYAGLLIEDGKERIDFTGLEFVRRDWTELAKKFQLEILDRVFHKKGVEEYVKGFIKDLMAGKYDGLLIYKKAIRKDLEHYTKTTPPHVKAARKLAKIESNLIQYVMTVNGPEPIEALTSKIDYDHYIAKQLKPLADSILTFYGLDFDSFLKTEQKKLFDY